MESEYRVVEAGGTHVPYLADIELAGASLFPPGSLPEHVRSEHLPQELLEEGVLRGRLFVALNGQDKPVGYALLQIVEGLALLAQIDVHPDHGRKGLGAALVSRIAARASEEGEPRLYLTTFANVPWNGPWYRRLGFSFLTPAQTPEALRDILEDERRHGLTDRIGMCLDLRRGNF